MQRSRLSSEDANLKKVNTVEALDENKIAEGLRIKQQIRANVANVYDLQKLRISAGNRMVQSFYISMGVTPSTSPFDDSSELSEEEAHKQKDKEDKERNKTINILKQEFERITDGILEVYKGSGVTNFSKNDIKKSIKNIQSSKDGKKLLKYLVDVDSYRLYESYDFLRKAEESAVSTLDAYVKAHPLWDAFFKDIKGCGTLMSAVCIAYLDPYKANHVSSFFRYCGIDTVQDEDEDGEKLFITQDGTFRKVRFKFNYVDADGEIHTGKVTKTGEVDAEGNELYKVDGELCKKEYLQKFVNDGYQQVYETVEDTKHGVEAGEEYVGEVVASMHGRRKGDTEMFEYTTKDGETALKRGITYNPIIKTKLMGVLTGCLIKAQDPVYSRKYYEHRQRLDNNAYHKKNGTTDGRKNMMAQRYMIKQFLRDLWTTWRKLEGLEVDLPYEVEYLGHKPHRDNEYQCREAGYKFDNK